jgi:hypothetical protein
MCPRSGGSKADLSLQSSAEVTYTFAWGCWVFRALAAAAEASFARVCLENLSMDLGVTMYTISHAETASRER